MSTIFVERQTDGTGDGMNRLVSLMEQDGLKFHKLTESDEGLIGKNDVVLLKINCQWDERGGTNTDLLGSVIRQILKHPAGFSGEIVVCDNGQAQFGANGTGGSMDWANNNALDTRQSVARLVAGFAKEHRVSAVLCDEFTTVEVKEYSTGDMRDGFVLAAERSPTGAQLTYPKFRTPHGTLVSFKQGVFDQSTSRYDSARLKVINMPVLKAHSGYQVTAAVKNYMGTTSDKLTKRDAHNAIARGFMGTQMAGTRVPVLNILDAIWINPSRGPRTTYSLAVQKNIIAASTDPVALDFWAAKHVLMPAAIEAKNSNYRVMDPEGSTPGTFGYWLRLSMQELRSQGIPVTMDENRIRVVESRSP